MPDGRQQAGRWIRNVGPIGLEGKIGQPKQILSALTSGRRPHSILFLSQDVFLAQAWNPKFAFLPTT